MTSKPHDIFVTGKQTLHEQLVTVQIFSDKAVTG